jgi:hypothetical protein
MVISTTAVVEIFPNTPAVHSIAIEHEKGDAAHYLQVDVDVSGAPFAQGVP